MGEIAAGEYYNLCQLSVFNGFTALSFMSMIYSAETADWLMDGSTLFYLESTCFILLSAFALLFQNSFFQSV